MKYLSFSNVCNSIRTRFGLVTACILLSLLATFYLGSRFIFVRMVREAEMEIQIVSSDIKQVIYRELEFLRAASAETVEKLITLPEDKAAGYLHSLVVPSLRKRDIHLAVLINRGGSKVTGFSHLPKSPDSNVELGELSSYLFPGSPVLRTDEHAIKTSGVMLFRTMPMCVAITPMKDAAGNTTGFVMIGTLLHHMALINRVNSVTHGILVSVPDRAIPLLPSIANGFGQAVLFAHDRKYFSGGNWHLSNTRFSVEMPMNDLLGKEVTAISISLPSSFNSIAQSALAWMTIFIAVVGMLFVIPVFWFQTRIVLNPLTRISEAIQDIGVHHLDGDCPKIHWDRKDEFGVLVESVNEMITALAGKTHTLAQEKDRQAALIASIPDCLCAFDTEARLEKIYKQPELAEPIPGLVLGQKLSPPFFLTQDCDYLETAIAKAFQTGHPELAFLSLRDGQDMIRHFEVRICKINQVNVLVVFRDITREKKESELRKQFESHLMRVEKIESLGALAAGIAHDVNNMLTVIQSTLELTWEDPTPEERDAIRTILQATEKGSKLTRELMTYAGQNQIQFKRENPNEIVMSMENLLVGVIAPNVILDLRLGHDLPWVDADPHQFWKVIINLIKNASESMNGMSGSIRISTYAYTLTEQSVGDFFSTHSLPLTQGVVFDITDTGSGIPKEMMKRIFEPFFSTKSVGRGLGLATVFGIVDMHNGGIAIFSEVGKGTTFRIWLPVAKTPVLKPDVSASDAELPSGVKKRSSSCVLVVEDDRAILQTTRVLLRSLQLESMEATNKREAMGLFRKHLDRINLILLDSKIEHLDNVRLLATFRRYKADVPVVIVSGYSEQKIQEMFVTQKYDGYLGKPYTRDELVRVIRPFIEVT